MKSRAERLSQEDLAAAIATAVEFEKGRIRKVEDAELDTVSGGIASIPTMPTVPTSPIGGPTMGMFPTEPTTDAPIA